MIRYAEGVGFAKAPITTPHGPQMREDIRNNTRVMVDEPQRAAWLFARLREHLPAELRGWRLTDLNERLRWYRYEPGERFEWHRDGWYRRSREERSRLTLMIYLSADFDGGETHVEIGGQQLSVVPEAGMAVWFPHQLMHTGAVVSRGRKYVLRTDVMYTR